MLEDAITPNDGNQEMALVIVGRLEGYFLVMSYFNSEIYHMYILFFFVSAYFVAILTAVLETDSVGEL